MAEVKSVIEMLTEEMSNLIESNNAMRAELERLYEIVGEEDAKSIVKALQHCNDI